MIGRNIILSVALSLCAFLGQGQTKRALLIGISEYTTHTKPSDDIWANIHGANDVELLSQTLNKQDFKIKKLTNKAATAHQIRKEFARFITSCRPGDIVYLHFSCHGQPVEDLNGDEEDGWDEAIIPVDAQKVYQKGKYTGENHIIDDELNEYLRSIRTKVGDKGFVYVVIDACHAGFSYRGDEEGDGIIVRGTNRGFTMSKKLYAPPINDLSKRSKIIIEKSNSMADICIIEACRSYEMNREILENGRYYGSLSFYVNQSLQTTKLGKNKTWMEHIPKMMKQDMRLHGQNPVMETSL